MFISYAQNFEDVILDRVFKDKKTGFYIDIGAHHPVHDSVTKAFYERGWRGINVEPVREFFELLQQDRPRDINLNVAVGKREEKLQFFELKGSGFSTCDREAAIQLSTERKLLLSCYEVSVTSLAEICKIYGCTEIDFLKIDVEGWEEQAIEGNDWEAFRPTVIVVEATLPESPVRRETNIADFLNGKGYRVVYFDGLNDYYLNEEFGYLSDRFKVAPNIFDNFSLFKVTDLQSRATILDQILQERDREISDLKDQLNYEHLNIKSLSKKLKILNLSLEDKDLEIQRLSKEFKKFKLVKDEQIKYYQYKEEELQILIAQSHHKILALEAELCQARERVFAMETSKFWKIRNLWFRLRKSLGIRGD
jgi:FkbM family methyltransferase